MSTTPKSFKQKIFFIIAILAISQTFQGCKRNEVVQQEQVKEIMPGLLQGYLSKEEIPNSLALIPPPPEEGSVAFALDQEYAKKALESKDTTRFNQAFVDAELYFPGAVKSFESTVGIEISESKTPKLYMLMRRVLTDAALATYGAKNHYKRERPFMVNRTPICTPKDEEALRKDGSYPSGHTAVGWAWALVFSEIFPEKTDAILQRGYAFGESRVICNVHWHSDVEMGRVMGATAVARLHANPTFLNDLAAAKNEVKEIKDAK
jgi:acid phosphatase (class A)